VVEQGHVERARPVVQVVLGRAHEPAEHIGA
jgi:hypothetical protein